MTVSIAPPKGRKLKQTMKRAPILRICLCGLPLLLLAGCQYLGGERSPEGRPAPRLVEISPEQEQILNTAAAARDAGDYDDALRLFQEILAENPTITTAYLGIGEIYIIKEEYNKAEPAFRRAARLEPRNFDAQYGHGLALQLLERFIEAIRAYHRALTIRPDDVKANLNIATVYLQMNDPDQAVIFAERAVALDPDSGAARANLGAIYEKLGRYDDAVVAYDAALELMGNRPQLMMNQINALAKQKRYREAANTAIALIRTEPSAPAYERLGWCHFKLREYGKSIQAYRDAVALDPQYWPAFNGIGVNALNTWLLSKKQDNEARVEARDAFRRSLRLNDEQNKVVELLLNYNL